MCTVVRMMSFVPCSFLPRSRYYDYRPNAHNAKCNAHIVRCSNVLSFFHIAPPRPLHKHSCPCAVCTHTSRCKTSTHSHSFACFVSVSLMGCTLVHQLHTPYLILFHMHNMHVQYIECLYKCDCFCCLFGKLFNITLAFVCIESAYVGWWCGNRVHNEYSPILAAETSLSPSHSPTHFCLLACSLCYQQRALCTSNDMEILGRRAYTNGMIW